jgi:PDZ domain-containing protein
LLTVAALAVVAVIAAALIPVQRWQQAPGSALPVAARLSVEGTDRYPTEGSVLFVTATGSQMSLLGWLLGAVDDDVDVLTYEQRFGPRTPAEQRRIGFQAMYGSKQVAEYVAARLLGLPASFVPGPAVVSETICDDARPPLTACEVLEVGDTIVAIDGTPTPLLRDVPVLLQQRRPGEEVVVTVRPFRRDTTEDRRLVLGSSGEDAPRAILGFRPADTRSVELPYVIDIDTNRIGGPSAGLAFTLALLDELSPGALTGSVRVAATGTIAEDGSVGAVGAVRQKAVAVARAGAEVFLVPTATDPAELAAIRRSLGESLQIIEVGTIVEALEVMGALGGDLSPLQLDGLASDPG